MASPPGLFYAYAKVSHCDWAGRFLITFADRATADEWWRAIVEAVNAGHKRFDAVKRVNAQFYTCTNDPGDKVITNTLTDDRVARRFLGRVFFTLLNDKDNRVQSIAPVLRYTDHISGRWYYIRSVLEHDVYWAFDDKNDRIIAKKCRPQTRFVITIRSGETYMQDEMVMIGTDIITIRLYKSQLCAFVAPDWKLTTSSAPLGVTFVFSDFINSFIEGHDGQVMYDPGSGDKWELVA